MSRLEVKGQGHQKQKKRAKRCRHPWVRTNGMRSLQTACSSSGRAHWLPVGVAQLCRPSVLCRRENQRMLASLFVSLFVCLFVCSHDNFRTIQRRMMKLDGWVHCTEISPEFQCHDQRSKVKVTGDKQTKKCCILFWSRPDLVLRKFYIRRWENQCMLSSWCFCCVGLVFPYN